MNFQDLDSYELLRLQNAPQDKVYYPNGRARFIRNGSHSDFYYETGRKAAELDLFKSSVSMPASYALRTWYKTGKNELHATGRQGTLPSWYTYFYRNGKIKTFVSKYLERQWDAYGNTTVCRVKLNNEWNNLIPLIKQGSPNISQSTLNQVIDKLIYTMRGDNRLPPYNTEFKFEARRQHMTKLTKNAQKSR